MSSRFFLDTNVLVYADDLDAGAKNAKAREILRAALTDGTGVVSTQVLQEFYVTVTCKLGVSAELAQRKVQLIAQLDLVVLSLEMIVRAIELHRLHQISFWDALVVQAAASAGCKRQWGPRRKSHPRAGNRGTGTCIFRCGLPRAG